MKIKCDFSLQIAHKQMDAKNNLHLQLKERKHSYANFNSCTKSLTFGAPVSVLFIYSYHTGLSAH